MIPGVSAPSHNLEITGQGPEGAAAKIPQELALELEENPQHLGDREDHLARCNRII
jgi:hypothetical protein